MNAWQKIKTVATFEFLSAVKRPGYLIATFGMPLFMAAYGAVVAVPAYFAEKGSRAPSVYGVVDEPGVLGLSGDLNAGKHVRRSRRRCARRWRLPARGRRSTGRIAADNFVFRPYTSRDEAHAALAARRLKGYFVIPQDYMREGALDAYTPDSFNVSGSDSRAALSDLLRRRLVEQRLDPAMSARDRQADRADAAVRRHQDRAKCVTAVRPRQSFASRCRWFSWCCS